MAAWREKIAMLGKAGLWAPVLLLLGAGASVAAAIAGQFTPLVSLLLLLCGLSVMVVALSWLGKVIQREMVEPVRQLRSWAQVAEQGIGKYPATVAVGGEFGALADDLNELIEVYCRQKVADDRRLRKEIKRLARKTSSLNILYDVAARISSFDSVEQLVKRSLESIKRMTGAVAVAIELNEEDGEPRLSGLLDENDQYLSPVELQAVRLCLCGRALRADHVICDNPKQHCVEGSSTPIYTPDHIELMEIPLGHGEQVPGRLRVYLPAKEAVSDQAELEELLWSIGDHLGVAIIKARFSAQAQRMKLLEARQLMAGDLHDSVAQSLNSIRFQLKSLSGRLHKGDTKAGLKAVDRIAGAVDEANRELRELLQRLREPALQHGLRREIKDLLDRFRRETGTKVFFQVQCRDLALRPDEELEVLRIVQESLANVRKHANARTVRVLLGSASGDGACRILVEDDGAGFDQQALQKELGDHIGLNLMAERAQRIGADLSIESEPGEGTQVILWFQPGAD